LQPETVGRSTGYLLIKSVSSVDRVVFEMFLVHRFLLTTFGRLWSFEYS